MAYGFIYILRNESMPGIYKIGSTFRSPMERASELSRTTAAQTPFVVVCYGEIDDPSGYEKDWHVMLEDWRVSDRREFFRLSFEHLQDIIGSIMEFCDHFASGDLSFMQLRAMSGA